MNKKKQTKKKKVENSSLYSMIECMIGNQMFPCMNIIPNIIYNSKSYEDVC